MANHIFISKSSKTDTTSKTYDPRSCVSRISCYDAYGEITGDNPHAFTGVEAYQVYKKARSYKQKFHYHFNDVSDMLIQADNAARYSVRSLIIKQPSNYLSTSQLRTFYRELLLWMQEPEPKAYFELAYRRYDFVILRTMLNELEPFVIEHWNSYNDTELLDDIYAWYKAQFIAEISIWEHDSFNRTAVSKLANRLANLHASAPQLYFAHLNNDPA